MGFLELDLHIELSHIERIYAVIVFSGAAFACANARECHDLAFFDSIKMSFVQVFVNCVLSDLVKSCAVCLAIVRVYFVVAVIKRLGLLFCLCFV